MGRYLDPGNESSGLTPILLVRSEIEKNAGKQFDPDVAKCMLAIMDEDVNYELHE